MGDVFDGQRVIFTHTKNNRLQWLQDWARFNRDIHGATGVLVYDNGSTEYTAADVLRALSAIDGLERIVVMSWPFKFGPQGDRFGRHWESFYFQVGFLENARHRFLTRARSVITSDVDEFVITGTGQSIFERVESAPFGVLNYHGTWILDAIGTATTTEDARRHRDYELRLNPRPVRRFGLLKVDANRCAAKYAVVPARCPERALWDTHRIRNWIPGLLPATDILFRHFRPISTNWKYDRDRTEHGMDDVQRDEAWITARARVRWDS
jgi:hypothetical protein